jgi:hypothetical protein
MLAGSFQRPGSSLNRSPEVMFGKMTILAVAATLSVAAATPYPVDAHAYWGYYGYAPGFVYAPHYLYAPRYYSYGGRTYDYYRRDFQLRGRNGA